MVIISQSYKVITSCKTVTYIHAINSPYDKKRHTDQSKSRINLWSWYTIMIISQTYNEVTIGKKTHTYKLQMFKFKKKKRHKNPKKYRINRWT